MSLAVCEPLQLEIAPIKLVEIPLEITVSLSQLSSQTLILRDLLWSSCLRAQLLNFSSSRPKVDHSTIKRGQECSLSSCDG